MDYAWTITRDCLSLPPWRRSAAAMCGMNVVGTIGPPNSTYWRSVGDTPVRGHDTIMGDPSRRIFQLWDNNYLRYEGYMVFNGDENASGNEPLIEFGSPYAGCTKIRYRNIDNGEWQWL